VAVINTQFMNLDENKSKKIIDAAMNEFIRSGYERASTNVIVKEAGISKGSLFNYFTNKKGLYLFLLDHSVSVIGQIYNETDWSERDIFKRMAAMGVTKFRIYKKHPAVFAFLKSTTRETSAEVKDELTGLQASVFKDGMEKSYKNIDFSKFREDMDIKKVMNIINWVIMGFAEQQLESVNSFDEVTAEHLSEWEIYFDILKRCFYKKEYI